MNNKAVIVGGGFTGHIIMKFDGYYDRTRFTHLAGLGEGYCVEYKGESTIKKTACFYNEKINFYIDSSDGVNDDLNIDEHIWRVKTIIADCSGKPFVMFKTSYSGVHSKPLVALARENNGDVVPYFLWSYYPEFKHIQKRRNELIKQKKDTKKIYDVGFCANLAPYYYPTEEGNEQLAINSRMELWDKLDKSGFNFFFSEKIKQEDYLRKIFSCKVSLNVPGIGEYSGRMLEGACLGQATVIRKNTYDNAISYRNYFPEIDFNADGWEDKLQNVIDNYTFWDRRASVYWDMVYTSQLNLFDYALSVVRQRI